MTYAEKSSYLQFGPNEQLLFISVPVNTWFRYTVLLLYICFLQIANAYINEMGSPILFFYIYNDQKIVIDDFRRIELQVLANISYFLSAIRGIFTILFSIVQMDIALWNVFFYEVCCIWIVHVRLSKKQFIQESSEV